MIMMSFSIFLMRFPASASQHNFPFYNSLFQTEKPDNFQKVSRLNSVYTFLIVFLLGKRSLFWLASWPSFFQKRGPEKQIRKWCRKGNLVWPNVALFFQSLRAYSLRRDWTKRVFCLSAVNSGVWHVYGPCSVLQMHRERRAKAAAHVKLLIQA